MRRILFATIILLGCAGLAWGQMGRGPVGPAIPSMTGNSGKVLTNNGSVGSWTALSGIESDPAFTAAKDDNRTMTYGNLGSDSKWFTSGAILAWVKSFLSGATTEILVGGGTAAAPVWTTATGTGAPVRSAAPAITVQEVDGHADGNLTASQVSSSVVYNTGQADANVALILPTAAAGYSSVFTVGTARAKKWGVRAKSTDKIYLLAADGTISAGTDEGYARMTEAQIGQSFACWTFKTDAYDWMCKAVSIGTSTFAAN